MAKKKKQKPFNLLYKFDPQKTGIDKVYDWVMGPGRIVVLMVMLVVILSFVYRFPLDRKLNDQINTSNEYIRQLDAFKSQEPEFKKIIDEVESAKKFINIYPENLDINSKDSGQVIYAATMKKILEVDELFKDDIILINYSYIADPVKGANIKLIGAAKTPAKAEDFRQKLLAEKKYISDILYGDLGSTKETGYNFGLDIKIRKSIEE
jgi:hypothetical protein